MDKGRLAEKAVNPVMRFLLRNGLAPRTFALLETTGRKTGKLRLTPIGNGLDGGTFWLVAEHGRRGDYVRNLIANPRVRVLADREWHSGVAELMPDDEPMLRREWIDERHGWMGRIDGKAFRANATTPCTIRVDLDS